MCLYLSNFQLTIFGFHKYPTLQINSTPKLQTPYIYTVMLWSEKSTSPIIEAVSWYVNLRRPYSVFSVLEVKDTFCDHNSANLFNFINFCFIVFLFFSIVKLCNFFYFFPEAKCIWFIFCTCLSFNNMNFFSDKCNAVYDPTGK